MSVERMNYEPIRLNEDEVLSRLEPAIGGVRLFYDHYEGKDLYSDGEIEDELLSIVENRSRVEYPSVIEEKMSWPILYHLSELRGNIVDFLPIGKNDKVLEIGSGCGAITDKLSRMAGEVVCCELSAKRSRINAFRNQDRDNISIHVGNFAAVEPELPSDFDWVCLIGVFEYASSYIASDDPYEDFLRIILKHVKPSGRAVIAIENKFGLKYFAGCAEDHVGTLYSSVEGYPEGGSARTFTRPGLEKLFAKAGVKEFSFYYPYPDYKFPTVVFSDRRLPHKGELTDNIRNFDRHRMLTFREDLVYDEILEDGTYPLFSNSYLAVLGPGFRTAYAKFSNDRKRAHCIRTVIEEENGERIVKKTPFYPEGAEHIRDLSSFGEQLTKKYQGSSFKINQCTLSVNEAGEDTASFDYIPGITLEQILDECLKRGEFELFRKYFARYFELASYEAPGCGITLTDYDLIFSNILVKGDEWTVIDYEWCMPKKIDPKQVAFRALYCYLLGDERRNAADMETLLSDIGIGSKEAEELREQEMLFQHDVTEHHKSLGELLAGMGTYAVDVKKLFSARLKEILDERIQVYFDMGAGFSEADSRYVPDVYTDERTIETDLTFDGNVRGLRIDPADRRCIVRIFELKLNGTDVLAKKKALQVNGTLIAPDTYVFMTEDPNIGIVFDTLPVMRENTLHIRMEVLPVSADMAEGFSKTKKKFLI